MLRRARMPIGAATATRRSPCSRPSSFGFASPRRTYNYKDTRMSGALAAAAAGAGGGGGGSCHEGLRRDRARLSASSSHLNPALLPCLFTAQTTA